MFFEEKGKRIKIKAKCTLNTNIRRGPKLEGCAFANFGNSSGTGGEFRKTTKNHVYYGDFCVAPNLVL